MSFEAGVLFTGKIPTSTTIYVPVPIRDGHIGAQIAWHDSTSSATITLEIGSTPSSLTAAGAADQWTDSGVTITGPGATAVGSSTVNVENCRQKLARFKIVTVAVTTLDIWDGGTSPS